MILAQTAPAVQIDADFSSWLLEQATALRQRNYSSLDWEHLAEELEDMYAHLKRDLASDLRVLLEHLIKLQYEPSIGEWRRRSRRWKVDAIEHRSRIHEILTDSPSLRKKLNEFIADAYPIAVRKVATQTNRKRIDFPAACPWTMEEIVNPDFFPNPFNQPEPD